MPELQETARIADELRRAQEGDTWHGSAARQILAGVSAAQAAARPIPNAHTIWELVLHITAWRGEVCRRLSGGSPALPAEGDWPPLTDTGQDSWQDTLARLDASSRALQDAAARFDAARLDSPVGPQHSPELGTVGSYYVMLHGVAQHDAYHLGQVTMLRKLLDRR
jgi:uncharacterized damage-inducible protein DinB